MHDDANIFLASSIGLLFFFILFYSFCVDGLQMGLYTVSMKLRWTLLKMRMPRRRDRTMKPKL